MALTTESFTWVQEHSVWFSRLAACRAWRPRSAIGARWRRCTVCCAWCRAALQGVLRPHLYSEPALHMHALVTLTIGPDGATVSTGLLGPAVGCWGGLCGLRPAGTGAHSSQQPACGASRFGTRWLIRGMRSPSFGGLHRC